MENGSHVFHVIVWVIYERMIFKDGSILTGIDLLTVGVGSPTLSYNYKSLESSLRSVGIPLKINYYFYSKNKFKVGLNLGVGVKYLIFAK